MIPMTLPRGMGKSATVWATGAAEFVNPPPPPPRSMGRGPAVLRNV